MIILQLAFSLATVIALSAGIPQLIKLVRLKSSAEFSLSTWMMWCLTQLTSVAYTITVGDPVLILANSLWCAFYLCMITLIMRYRPVEQRRFAFARLYLKETALKLQPTRLSTDINEGINDDINKVY